MKEYAIGETFPLEGEIYLVVEDSEFSCAGCVGWRDETLCAKLPHCNSNRRTDRNYVIYERQPKILAENACQCAFFLELAGDNNDLTMFLIDHFAERMREIIKEFQKQFDRLPTKEDFLWILSEQENRNLRDIVKERATQLQGGES